MKTQATAAILQAEKGGYTKVTTTVKAKDNSASQLDKAAAARGEAVAASALFGGAALKKKGKKGTKKADATAEPATQALAASAGAPGSTADTAVLASAAMAAAPAPAQPMEAAPPADDGMLVPDSVAYIQRRKVLEQKLLRASKKVAEAEATLAGIPAAPAAPSSHDLVRALSARLMLNSLCLGASSVLSALLWLLCMLEYALCCSEAILRACLWCLSDDAKLQCAGRSDGRQR